VIGIDFGAPRQQLLSAYHHRRTSACYVSFIPDSVRALAALSDELPEEPALQRVRELGFTTIVIHHRNSLPAGDALDARFRAAAEREGSTLTQLAADPERTAYGITEATR
jgi:hypothetical protein